MAVKVRQGRGGPRPGSGRKPKAVDERQRNRVMFTLTDGELARLEQAAEGIALGTFARELVLRCLARRTK